MCTRDSIKNDVLDAVQQYTVVTLDPKSPNVEALRLHEDLGLEDTARANLAASFHKFSKRCGGNPIGPGDTQDLKTIKECIDLIASTAKCNV
jgi:hypothetical protein